MTEQEALTILVAYLSNKPNETQVGISYDYDKCPLACALRGVTGQLWHVSYYASWVHNENGNYDAERSTNDGFEYTSPKYVVYHFVRIVDKLHEEREHPITAQEARTALLKATIEAIAHGGTPVITLPEIVEVQS